MAASDVASVACKEIGVSKEKTPRLRFAAVGSTTVVELTDRRILDEVSIGEIGDQLFDKVARSDSPQFVVDFSSVAHMSSSALGMLITLHKRIREKGGELRLCGIQPAIQEVFVITRLNEIFQISQTREQALSTLKS
jgi:anti-sigma B factor antagonist